MDQPLESIVAQSILEVALKAPYFQIMENAGIASDDAINNTIRKEGFSHMGFDVKQNVFCDMVKSGIIDPAKVTKSALLNAVSVATTILSTNAIVTLARTYEAQ